MAVAQIAEQLQPTYKKNLNIYEYIHKSRPALLVRTLNHFNPWKITISCFLTRISQAFQAISSLWFTN
jgi:hypothetical protein